MMMNARPAVVAVALLALASLTTTAHAADNDDTTNKKCTITNRGDRNNLSCGQMIIGNNNITGNNHSVGLGAPGPLTSYTVSNATGSPVTVAACPGTCSIGVNQQIPNGGMMSLESINPRNTTFSFSQNGATGSIDIPRTAFQNNGADFCTNPEIENMHCSETGNMDSATIMITRIGA
ncbi:hypothetical protein ABT187_50205 [Streptomyces sp. NPDC001817]|uniref:hypothetical protein n=1 Tax=Streptomyces sp. NPDC001817 TaxID=3154398 RepID=UPI00333306C9